MNFPKTASMLEQVVKLVDIQLQLEYVYDMEPGSLTLRIVTGTLPTDKVEYTREDYYLGKVRFKCWEVALPCYQYTYGFVLMKMPDGWVKSPIIRTAASDSVRLSLRDEKVNLISKAWSERYEVEGA